MLKKRIIGVITVLEGWAVQSFGYEKYLPLGKPAVIAENLDNWGADEIFIQSINRSKYNQGPDIELLKSISQLSLSTPITYAGGISCLEDALLAIKTGCERIALDNLLHENLKKLNDISLTIGSQSIIASVPVSIVNKKLLWFDYKRNIHRDSFLELENMYSSGLISEIFLVDKNNEGSKKAFDKEILDHFPLKDTPLILFGGITANEQIKDYLNKKNIAAIAIGNSLNYKEHSVQTIKKEINHKSVREYNYKKINI